MHCLSEPSLKIALIHAHDTHTQVCVQVGDLLCDWIV